MNHIQNAGLYLHIPFCLSKCNYCDFFSIVSGDGKLKEDYISALIKEMEIYKRKNTAARFTSIYLGGGTPTVLSGVQLEEILKACLVNFTIDKKAEITIEANPGTINVEKCKFLLGAGVNRLSLGAQSFEDRVLRKIGRIHTKKDFLSAYYGAREAGFNNINVDIMFGLPGQSKNSFEKTLAELLLLKPEHISLYALTLEPETPLGKLWAAGTLKMPSDDFIDALFLIAMEQLEKHNYEHYEISNFALPGKRCIHNQFYWNYQSYVGMGAGSTSFINNKRYRNYQDLKKYICLLGYEILPIEYQEILSLSERMSESIILKLRMMEGIAKTDFKKLFGVPIEQIFYQSLELLKEQELLAENKTHYFLTKKGISLANNVFLEFLI